MRRAFAALAALCITVLSLPAQEIRTNYRSQGITHISTDYEPLEDFVIRVERVDFADGESMFQLFIDLRQKTYFTAPKGVKMTATLPGGAVIRASQIGQDSATKAPLQDGLYLNRLRYALEASDVERMTRGVRSLELVTGWDPDDYLQYTFKDDAFGRLLKRHCDCIEKAAETTIDLTAEAASRLDQTGSVMTAARPLVATGENLLYNIILNHLYYKNTAAEDIDLAFQLGTEATYHISADAPVTFVLADGTEITLPQTRDDENFLYLYPSLPQLRSLAYGHVTALRIQTEDGTLTDAIPDDSFSKAVNQQYQLLMSLSAR